MIEFQKGSTEGFGGPPGSSFPVGGNIEGVLQLDVMKADPVFLWITNSLDNKLTVFWLKMVEGGCGESFTHTHTHFDRGT